MKFEVVSRFAGQDIQLPTRATKDSAGYDFYTAEDVIIPSVLTNLSAFATDTTIELDNLNQTLNAIQWVRPTLISTGVKCELDSGKFLALVNRSSSPLKYWLLQGNAPGIIDADYYNNPSNEGEIFFQVYNMTPFNIKITKGTRICQGIIQDYYIVDDDAATGERTGGFGSTTNEETTGARPGK